MSNPNSLDDLPKYKNKHMVSLLFLLTSDTGTVEEDAIVVPSDADMIVFSDRPHRIAGTIKGGVKSFAEFYAQSSFKGDPPNVTFAGSTNEGDKPVCSVLELGQPKVDGDLVRFPILRSVGEEIRPDAGHYQNVSMVFDDVWDSLGDVLEVVGGVVTTGAAALGTLAACTVGEVATLGAATLPCVAAVGATIGAAALTVDSVGNVISQNSG